MLKSKDPLIRVKYDSILVIINRLIKYSYFVPYLKVFTVKQLINTILRVIVVNHGMLKEFITDKDKLFILNF